MSDETPNTAQESAPAAAPAPAPERPKKPAAPPDPRVDAAKAQAEQLAAAIQAALGADAVEEIGAAHVRPMVRIAKSQWEKTVDFVRTLPDWKLNYVECMAGTDYREYLEVVLYIQSTEFGHFVCLKTRTERDGAEIPSLASVHPGTNWEEREIYDLLGITFTGHPDLRRILMWDEFKGYPLRKDYSEWED